MSLALIADRIAASAIKAIAEGKAMPDAKMIHGICYMAQPDLPEKSRERLVGLVTRRLVKVGAKS